MGKPVPETIMYSVTLHVWEAWRNGRPVMTAYDLGRLLDRYPNALPVSRRQCRMADVDQKRAQSRARERAPSKDQRTPP